MDTQERINYLVKKLDLLPHPEGGFYKETYRSKQILDTPYGERSLMTSIYFLLTSENVSHFHRIKSDEHWYFHEGSPLTIHLLDRQGHRKLKLGPSSEECAPHHLVEKKLIFGSTVDEKNAYSLVSCVVAPGFDFKDFELFKAEDLLSQYPDHREIIERLT
ncbi:cupin domain-containing protein [Algoriphagus sediminis]|uniref:Cupin domain-containing protein n=1 Tax=Algoriphagus sediminis TaxID=3057113 RepID=A0ABT7YBI9_9BACT|nr:cupin domain-containing protein [Algoriphagus sediminis]MDN3203816.1 cupin domain-containing protein [Algoriphagus sediminis]